MPARTLITGGAGFIGSHLAARCVAEGEEVHVLARPGTSLHRLELLGRDITIHRLRLGDATAVARCVGEIEPDRIYHLATETRSRTRVDVGEALEGVRDELCNLLILLKAMAAARLHPEVLVRAGSIAEYGEGPTLYREDQREEPATPYAAALVAGTHYCRMLQPTLPFPIVTARLALVYGPGQSEAFLLPALIRNCLGNRPSTVRRPEDRRDLLHIDDAVDALRRIAAAPPGCSVINISTGNAPTMREAATHVIEATGVDPALVDFSGADDAGAVSILRAAPDRARDVLGWLARTPLAEGVARTVAEMRTFEPMAV